MTFDVVFTKRAEKDFENILKYIESKFGFSSGVNFKKLVYDFASTIQLFPEIGSLEVENKGICASVVHYRLKIFYRIKGHKIIILRLFDTRQHPERKFQ